MGNINFDASEVEPYGEEPPPIPAGWYQATIVSASFVLGKSPDAGEMVHLQVEINANEHPELRGRRAFAWLCVNHQKDTPRNIAQKQLSSICHAVEDSRGTLELDDTEELVGENLMVKLKIRPASDQYPASNDIANFAASGSQKTLEAPGVSPTVSVTDNTSETGGAANRPWGK
jgi:hypothetical protein